MSIQLQSNTNLTGSLNVTGSLTVNGSTFLTTASVASNTITFTKGDGTTFPITVNTGSGGGGGGGFPYTGSAEITGSLTVTGSISSKVLTVTATAGTASYSGYEGDLFVLDCSKANNFAVTLDDAFTTVVDAINFQPGQQITLKVFQSASGYNPITTNLQMNTNILFPSGSGKYQPSTIGKTDTLIFNAYDTSSLYFQYAKNYITASIVGGGFVDAAGGQIFISGSTTYHVFTASGQFDVNTGGPIELFAVAGGGGGGSRAGGGGGGGGVVLYPLSAAKSVNSGSYTVTIGAGGAGAIDGTSGNGTNGGDTIFTGSNWSITAIGGGTGGGYPYIAGTGQGQPGGSGGGSQCCSGGVTSSALQPTASGDSGTYGYGNYGGDYSTGGGGGAGAAPTGSDGGAGLNYTWSGSTIMYGSGAGSGDNCSGKSAGSGSSGAGDGSSCGSALPGGSGTANRGGGGGGGAGNNQNGGPGGSGIVIISYLNS